MGKGLVKEQVEYIEKTLQMFHASQIVRDQKMGLLWNVLNVFIRALINKGIISQTDLEEAGCQLLKELREEKSGLTPVEEAGKWIKEASK